uniref:C3H1-type domain-containing protein n=1 Tax=Dracunculus medinensis TaxID=318479 RepID=A0A0N4UC91_DRAME
LEGDDDSTLAKKENETGTEKKPNIPNKGALDTLKRTTPQKTNLLSTTSPKISSVAPATVSSSSQDKKPATTPAPRVRMSNTFMDALMDPVNKKPAVKLMKKKPAVVKPASSVMPSVMEGLYSDTSKSLNKEKEKADQTYSLSKKIEAEETDIASNRKIRFADEFGQELVQIRLFEVEEGERLNVSKLSSEDMKHLEMQRERSFMREFGIMSDSGRAKNEGITYIPTVEKTDFAGISSSVEFNSSQLKMFVVAESSLIFMIRECGTPRKIINLIEWKLKELDNACCLIERGSQSEAKLIEDERQKTVMRPFYGPSMVAEMVDADEEIEVIPHSIVIIPLEMLEDEIQTSDSSIHSMQQEPVKETVIPGPIADQLKSIDVQYFSILNLQKLMMQLKKTGIVSSGSDLANILNKVSSSGVSLTASTTTASIPNISAAVNTTIGTHSYAQVDPIMASACAQSHTGLAHGYAISVGQFLLPTAQPQSQSSHQPLLNGPVPAGFIPTVGVDPAPQNIPSSSDSYYGAGYIRFSSKPCTFYQAGSCNYGSRCRFSHGDEPTAATHGGAFGRFGCYDDRGRGQGRGGPAMRGIRGSYSRDSCDTEYRRGRGYRREYYERDQGRNDRDRRGYDRYGRRRNRSRSQSRSKSRSPSRKPRSPDKRITRDRDERTEKRFSREEREKNQKSAMQDDTVLKNSDSKMSLEPEEPSGTVPKSISPATENIPSEIHFPANPAAVD